LFGELKGYLGQAFSFIGVIDDKTVDYGVWLDALPGTSDLFVADFSVKANAEVSDYCFVVGHYVTVSGGDIFFHAGLVGIFSLPLVYAQAF